MKVEEIARLYEEELTQLGPVVDRNQNEKYSVIIDRVFGIMLRSGQFLPVPEELKGASLKIEFISAMARAQRMVGVENIERGLSFAGNLVGVFPEVVDRIDADEMMSEYYDMLSIPPKGVRSDQEVEALRASRAQQQQAQAAAAAAPAVADAAKAAELLSKTTMAGGDTTALDAMMGVQ